MRWCFENAAHPYADGILKQLAAGDTAIVPVLWFYEASAVLSRAQNNGTLAGTKAAQFIAELHAEPSGASLPHACAPRSWRGAAADVHRARLDA
jgi:hypothetical protein